MCYIRLKNSCNDLPGVLENYNFIFRFSLTSDFSGEHQVFYEILLFTKVNKMSSSFIAKNLIEIVQNDCFTIKIKYCKFLLCDHIYIYKVVISVCLFVCLITQKPPDRLASNFVQGTRETHRKVLSLVLRI